MNYHETAITVRFNEVDAYQVAWHGHYVAWMEIGRSELAGRFGLDAFQLGALGYLGPVVALEIKYLRSARYNDLLTVRTTLTPSETATLVFESVILDPDGKKLATGLTRHALTDLNGVLQFQMPPAVAERVERMKAWLEAT
ncbi:acyl-CoA thioesterase [Oryzomonas sagensis]|uniref:Acyl-CoA thioesterase n=1 Tax=Oryzomonas sagensis TaxID=2603857 RepID=A0ABQ6TMV6_9BACT|nr:acyl-CoA thioesterase [Oryzomonas sagensis]KAB0669805.1 acyl-CoA thioesterase [Oryzomonas sagensis]